MLSLSTETRLKITQQDPVVPELAQALPARSGWAERLRSPLASSSANALTTQRQVVARSRRPLAAPGVGSANVTFEMQERKR